MLLLVLGLLAMNAPAPRPVVVSTDCGAEWSRRSGR